jgi:phosphoribosylformylglycinamidine cyclo-ligase
MPTRSLEEVNIDLGDDMSRMFDEAAQLTYDNIPGAVWRANESFRSPRGIDGSLFAHDVANLVFSLGFDGIGTKVEVRERMQRTHGQGASHRGSAFDLLAMVCDDAPRGGLQVIAWGSVLDTGKLDENNPLIVNGMRELAEGMVLASRAAGVIAINGEIAELIGRVRGYGPFNYNWGAGVLTVGHKDRILTGKQLKAGDKLVGLPELGMRCNAMTDARITLKAAYGSSWHRQKAPELGELTLGQLVQIPATIYHNLMTRLTGGWDITREPEGHVSGYAHITGGGQRSKLATMLEGTNLGIVIYDPIDPPAIQKHVQELAGYSDEKTYGKFHMGPGAVVATNNSERVIELAAEEGIEGAKEMGYVTDEPGIRVKNRGVVQNEEWLELLDS